MVYYTILNCNTHYTKLYYTINDNRILSEEEKIQSPILSC